ncbi:GDSL-type esterase/lipase family protein [Zongyangia hominis]|uniref:SGNH hydrolase-type esterase domain-containing protein n=1 Tax=Zongyangia hominis TaxID=2763677 RepID=A0A926IAS2_9FIRM|nr:GDSL-type esterase/lipase family protein [Zongyangia hominis]MBC8569402.1 hypothetical protein [Zongyangia hominis]
MRRRRKKSGQGLGRRWGLLAFALIFALMSALPMGALTASGAGSSLSNWKGGSFTEQGDVVSLGNTGGSNNVVVSDTSAKAFVFEADMKVTDGVEGGEAGLLFGVENRDNPGNQWCCMKVRKAGLWAFNLSDYTQNDGLLINMPIPKFTLSGETVHLKLVADMEGNLSFYVSDMDTPVTVKSYPKYQGGYVGFTTWNAAAEFTNVSFVDNTPPTQSVLGAYKGGSFTESGSAITLGSTGGDNVVVSETYAKAFVFEADMTVPSSAGEAGLLFGVKNRDNPGNQWCCMKVRQQGLWAFNLSDYQEAEGLLINLPINNFTFQGKNHLKLVADGDGNLSFYVNDMENPVTTKSYPRYQGGYLGFTSIGTEATFENIQFTDTTIEQFNSNLTGWEAVNSTWHILDNGIQGSTLTGDGFYTAAESVSGDFTLQADVTVESGTALGLVFHAQGSNVAVDGSYVVNCDIDAQCFKFFRFPSYGMSLIASKSFAEAGFTPVRGKNYPMKLSMADGKATMYFDNQVIFDQIPDINTANPYTGGRVGIMGCNAMVRFQNVYLRTGSSNNALTDFTLEPHIQEMMDGNNFYYIVPASSDVKNLAPTFTIPAAATVDKASGSAQDFSSPVTYTVTAANGDEALYTVTVYSEAAISQADRDKAQAISQRIGALPEPLTAADKDAVTALKADYDGLTTLQKMLVVGRDKLANAVAQVEKLTRPLRITCVGDSITQGVGSSNEGAYSYPAQLQKILGDGYQVKNAGVSGSNVTKDKGFPYWTTARYREGKDFAPDIAIIMIGTNDALNDFVWNPSDPQGSNSLFRLDYNTLIEEYKALPNSPKIFMVLPMVSYQTEGRQENLVNYIIPTLREIAKEQGIELIDMNAFTTGHPDWFPDGLHPHDTAYGIIAGEFAKYIRGYADPKLSAILVDGKPLEGFDASADSFDVIVPRGATIPAITATAADNDAKVVVSGPITALPGEVAITVTSGDGRSTKTYTVRLAAQKQTLQEAYDAARQAIDGYQPSNDTTADALMALVQGAIENDEITAAWSDPMSLQPATGQKDGKITGEITLSKAGETPLVLSIEYVIPKLGGGTQPPEKPSKPSIGGGNHSGFTWPDLSGGQESGTTGKANPQSGDNSQIAVALLILAASACLVFHRRGKK